MQCIEMYERVMGKDKKEVLSHLFSITRPVVRTSIQYPLLELWVAFFRSRTVLQHAKIYLRMAQSRQKLGETGAALENAKNAVRIYRMHGVNNQWSREAEEEVRQMQEAEAR